ncbi:MAG: hypothetical protein H0T51_03280, partial [Pirellulales bacterium]|nr:hypothetical protein [Pirellulales bacterium]
MKRHLAVLVFIIGSGVTNQAIAQVGTALFQENFDGLTLLPSVNIRTATNPTTEVVARADAPGTIPHQNAFTHTPPAGWMVHQNWDNFGNVDLNNPDYSYNDIVGNIGIGNQGNPNAGVDEWEGWSFADSDFWLVADGQLREDFTNGLANHSTIAVADNDEYDDFGGGLGDQYYNTGMTTNNIPVAGKTSVNFSFDSSWRNEDHDDNHVSFPDNPATPDVNESNVNNQTSIFYASFDGGTPVLVKQWNSDDSDPNFKPDAVNERVDFNITVPAGTQNMKLTLGQLNSGNDWWWAVDNLAVANTAGGAAFWTENFESVQLGPSVNERLSDTVFAPKATPDTVPKPNSFTHTPPANWGINNDNLS